MACSVMILDLTYRGKGHLYYSAVCHKFRGLGVQPLEAVEFLRLYLGRFPGVLETPKRLEA